MRPSSRHRVLFAGLGLGAAVLAVPALAMANGADVDWSTGDFILAATLLTGSSVALDATWNGGGGRRGRLARTIAFATALFLFVSNLAVGIVRDESHPANLMSFFVVGFAIAGGGLLVRTPRLAIACLLIAAGVQASMAFIAMAVWSLPFDAGMARSASLGLVVAAALAAAASLVPRRPGAGSERRLG